MNNDEEIGFDQEFGIDVDVPEPPDIDAELLHALSQQFNIENDWLLKAHLEKAHQVYYLHFHKEYGNIDRTAVRKQLKNIQSASVKLLKRLDELYPQGILDVVSQSGQTFWRPNLVSHLRDTINHIDEALTDNSGLRETRNKQPEYYLYQYLGIAFKDLTADDPCENMKHTQGRAGDWTGRFVEFVTNVCMGLDLPIPQGAWDTVARAIGKKANI